MRPALAQGAALLVLLAAAPAAFAEDELVLESDHHVMHGKVVESTADSVTFDHIVGGKSVGVETYPASAIVPISFYVVRRDAVEGDAAGCMELGQFCLDNGLHARARHLFETAARLDPSIAAKAAGPKAHARELGAAELLAEAKDAAAHGKSYAAWHKLQECVRNYGDTPSGRKAKELVQPYFDAYHEDYTIKGYTAADRADDDLKGVQRVLDLAAKHNSKALEEKNLSQGLREYDKAVREYERALEKLDKLAAREGLDEVHEDSIASIQAQARSDAIHAHLNKAGIYLTREAFQDALRETNQALAIDETSSEAKSYRMRVAMAAGAN